MSVLKIRLSPVATLVILLLFLCAAGGGFYYWWNFTGKERPMSTAEAMEAGRRQAARDPGPKTPPPQARDLAPPSKPGAPKPQPARK